MYTEQIDKQKKMFMSQQNDQDVIEQLKDELRKLAHDKILQEEMIQRLEGQISRNKEKIRDLKLKKAELEQSEKRLAQALAERDREVEREKGQFKIKFQKLEGKLQKKKDKIRGLIFDFQEKEQEVERVKEEMNGMRDKMKQLNKLVKEEKKAKQQLE